MPHYFAYLKQQTERALADQVSDNQEILIKELKQLKLLVNYMKVIINSSKRFCRYGAAVVTVFTVATVARKHK